MAKYEIPGYVRSRYAEVPSYHLHENIPGWCNFRLPYREIVGEVPENALLIEVGVFCGQSLSYLCEQVWTRRKQKNVRIIGVDSWDWENGNHARGLAQWHADAWKQLGVDVSILPLDSLAAAKQFSPGEAFSVWIDGDHSYEAVKADLRAWLPIVQEGGWLGGDDYCVDWPEVAKAVDELLPERIVGADAPMKTPQDSKWWRWRKNSV